VGKQKELGQCWVKLSLPFFTPVVLRDFAFFGKNQNQGQKSKIKSILKKQKRATI